MSKGQNFSKKPSTGIGKPSCNLRKPVNNRNQLTENNEIATNWSSGVRSGNARGKTEAIKKNGAHAVVYSIHGPKGFNLCLIQHLVTSGVEANSQFPPGFSSPARFAGVDSLAGYQRDSPLNQSESRAPCTTIPSGCSYLVRTD